VVLLNFVKENFVMANVKFQKQVGKPTVYYFPDLQVNESFRVKSPASRGAIYRKIYYKDTHEYLQMEEATGQVFKPTHSPVEVVGVEVTIDAVKPSIY
jgi:hypothetical protein